MIAKVTKQYKPKGKRKRSRPQPPPPTKPGLPSILIDDIQLSDLTDQALAALIRSQQAAQRVRPRGNRGPRDARRERRPED